MFLTTKLFLNIFGVLDHPYQCSISSVQIFEHTMCLSNDCPLMMFRGVDHFLFSEVDSTFGN